jgi:hypothetical protein
VTVLPRPENAVTVPDYSCPHPDVHHERLSGEMKHPANTPDENRRLLQRRGSAHNKASLPSGSVKHDIGVHRRLCQQRGSVVKTSRIPIYLHPITRYSPPELGGFPTSAYRFSKSRGKGLTSNGNPKTRSEQSWRIATRGRLRENGYVCFSRKPFQNLSRNLFPPRRFSLPGDSAAFNGTARQPSHRIWGLGMHHPAAGLTAAVRCSQVPRWGQTK